ncbi:SOS response-associated peptidase [Zavarzinia sp. CC-PAN008]|uniref:SOS response-associated peptidase n=1 Tax=Zavarzinia sp. CC-PAN008 TaxID=3243332 RepID=UPI003F748A24
MCGRYLIVSTLDTILNTFDARPGAAGAGNFPPRHNVAPTQAVPIVREAAEAPAGRELVHATWGLIPFWAKDRTIGPRCINARSETVTTTPAFREAYKRRRCLVVMDGFYEWQKTAGRKGGQPHRIGMADQAPFATAGLWERWTDKETGQPLDSCTILTTTANALLAPLHDRMPVILDAAAQALWLDPAAGDASVLLRPYPAERMALVPVDPAVGNVRNQGPFAELTPTPVLL